MRIKQGEKAYLQMPVEVKTVDKELGTLEAIFSTQDVDRHGDVVLQDGWDLKNFKKNPVILNSHNYGDAAEVIGKASDVSMEARKLQGKITFAVNENPKARVIFDLYAGGFLSAFSVGFIPKKFKENKDGTTDWYTIEEAELLEVSAVSVPANARALAKSKGIDVDLIGENDDDETDSEADDEVSEDSEVPAADGATPPGNGDGGEGGSADGDEAPKPTADPVEEPEAPAEKVVPSYQQKVAAAIGRIETRERQYLKQVSGIIKDLLSGKDETNLTPKTQDQVRRRKMNQAIRMLMKVR